MPEGNIIELSDLNWEEVVNKEGKTMVVCSTAAFALIVWP
jgi:hypothetical protein